MIKTFAQDWLKDFWDNGKHKRVPSELKGRLVRKSLIRSNRMLPKGRRPTSPGEILKLEFMEDLGLTQKQLAEALGITRVRLNEIINGKRAITADSAFRLSRYLGTTVEFWLNLQRSVDLWDTLQAHGAEYGKIEPVARAANG